MAAMSASIASRTQSRKSVATWSLRERAVCRRPAAGPISSLSRLSTFMCTSSSARENVNAPASISPAMWSSPLAISRASVLVMMPASASMAACALEPRMSCGASALSKPIEAFISSMISAGDIAKRPPHILLAVGAGVFLSVMEKGLPRAQDKRH